MFNLENDPGCELSFITSDNEAFLARAEDFLEAPRALLSSAVGLDLAVFDFGEF
jgi:hypothetical protein